MEKKQYLTSSLMTTQRKKRRRDKLYRAFNLSLEQIKNSWIVGELKEVAIRSREKPELFQLSRYHNYTNCTRESVDERTKEINDKS